MSESSNPRFNGDEKAYWKWKRQREKLSKQIVLRLGGEGNSGGWIVLHGKPICKGWWKWAIICVERGWILDGDGHYDASILSINWEKVLKDNAQ